MVEDLYSHLLPIFMNNNQGSSGQPGKANNSGAVLTEVWAANKNVMINTVSELYERNPKAMNLSRILDIFRNIKVPLTDVLEATKDYDFAIQLGLLGSKTDYLHLDFWIDKMIKEEGDPFVRSLLLHIDRNIGQPALEANGDAKKIEKIIERSQLDEDKLCMIFDKIHSLSDTSPDMLEFETKRLEKSLIECFTKTRILPTSYSETNNDEIEEKANEYFQQLYKGEKKVEDLVDIMKEFRSSPNSTERETYACMVQNLFDEWKFFPKYPKKELSMTARLFGKIICEKKIIDGVITDIGLKCIVEGLKREGKMFDFAITALEECKASIDHQTGLKNILACKQLQEKKQDLYDFIAKRYNELHGPTEQEDKSQEMMNRMTPQNPATMIQPVVSSGRQTPQNQPMVSPNLPMPMPRMGGGEGYYPQFIPKKPGSTNPLVNTPTQPGKHFDTGTQWRNTPQQVRPKEMFTNPMQQQQKSARPFEPMSLGPSAQDAASSLAPKALKLTSKDFKPKTQLVQEYLKKEDI